jgi:hypothetical protein
MSDRINPARKLSSALTDAADTGTAQNPLTKPARTKKGVIWRLNNRALIVVEDEKGIIALT